MTVGNVRWLGLNTMAWCEVMRSMSALNASTSVTTGVTTRRQALQHGVRVASLLAATGLFPSWAWAYNQRAFEGKTVGEAVAACGGLVPLASKDVSLSAPDLAENGALVPLGLSCSLPGVKQLLLLVEKNPHVLVALFNLTDAVEPQLATRAKMAQTSDVYAVAILQDGRAFFARKEVRVTLGGCSA